MRNICLLLLCAILSGMLTGCHKLPFHYFPIAGMEGPLHRLEQELPVSEADLESIPLGARVEIVDQKTPESTYTFTGTLIHSSPHGAVLSNCECKGRTMHTPRGLLGIAPFSGLFKYSGVGVEWIPVQWVSITKMSKMKVLEQPTADYVAPNLDIDTNERRYFERIGIDFAGFSSAGGLQAAVVKTCEDRTQVEEPLRNSAREGEAPAQPPK